VHEVCSEAEYLSERSEPRTSCWAMRQNFICLILPRFTFFTSKVPLTASSPFHPVLSSRTSEKVQPATPSGWAFVKPSGRSLDGGRALCYDVYCHSGLYRLGCPVSGANGCLRLAHSRETLLASFKTHYNQPGADVKPCHDY